MGDWRFRGGPPDYFFMPSRNMATKSFAIFLRLCFLCSDMPDFSFCRHDESLYDPRLASNH